MNDQFMALTADEIDLVDDVIIEKHPVPEWGQNRGVYVRSISAEERGQIEAEAARFKESKGRNDSFARTFTVKMAWLGMCNEHGEPLYGKATDVARLQKKNAAAIAHIAEHVQRLSGLTQEEIEALEKNSGKAQPEDSPSD